MKQFYVYILASHSRRLYVGVSNNLLRRLYEHLLGLCAFTSKYRVNRLVYYEVFEDPVNAIRREKRIKKLPRGRKIELIEAGNSGWIDLAAGWFQDPPPPRQTK